VTANPIWVTSDESKLTEPEKPRPTGRIRDPAPRRFARGQRDKQARADASRLDSCPLRGVRAGQPPWTPRSSGSQSAHTTWRTLATNRRFARRARNTTRSAKRQPSRACHRVESVLVTALRSPRSDAR
jgi:hypothetical protein